MELHATSEKDLITKYVTLLGTLASFNKRETEVAIAFVLVYRRIKELQDSQDDDTPEEEIITDIMTELKAPDTLQNMVKKLDMPFSSFRKYVAYLKQKGFFKEGDINPMFIPDGDTAIIKISRS